MAYTNEKNKYQDEKFEQLRSQGIRYSDDNQFDKAVMTYKEALKIKPKQIQVMGELCWCLGQIDCYEEMLETAKKALLIAQKRGSKDNIGRFYFYIGQYYKIKEQYKEAFKYFILAMTNKPRFISNYLDAAYCQQMLENYKGASEIYERVAELDPEYAEKNNLQNVIEEMKALNHEKIKELPYIRRGIELEKQEDYEQANVEFSKAVEIAPDSFFPLMLLFSNEISLRRDYYKAIGIGNSLIPILNNKDNRDESSSLLENVWIGLHNCYKAIGDEDNSIRSLKNAECYYHVNNGKKEIGKKDYVKALEEFKTAFAIRNDLYIVLDNLIETSFELHKYDEAVDYAVIALKLAKANNDNDLIAKYYFYLGERYDISQYDKAIELYKNAMDITTDIGCKLKYCRCIARYFWGKGELNNALDYYHKCLDIIETGANDIFDIKSDIVKLEELLDENSDLKQFMKHYNIGGKYFNEMNFEEAAIEMEKSLEYIPQDVDAMDCLNRCLYKLKRFDECYDVAYEGYLVSLRDRDFRFYDMFCYNIANIFYNNKNYEKALSFFGKALEAKPDDVDYLYFVAACYRNLGNFKEAFEFFKIAYQKAPDDQQITEQLNLCESMIKNF